MVVMGRTEDNLPVKNMSDICPLNRYEEKMKYAKVIPQLNDNLKKLLGGEDNFLNIFQNTEDGF